ncbi:MAG: hypothetical protein LC778_20995 [Acidobacteria bacterium]|nr:hypothetical protein [Acidobacteriota bacterium]
MRQKFNHTLDVNVRICTRKVFLMARYAWHGLTVEPPMLPRAFLLKQTWDLSAWCGQVVHVAIDQQIIPGLKHIIA